MNTYEFQYCSSCKLFVRNPSTNKDGNSICPRCYGLLNYGGTVYLDEIDGSTNEQFTEETVSGQ